MARITRGGGQAVSRREDLREEAWPDDIPWLGPDETGFFCAPRTLPLVLRALGLKKVSGSQDPGPVYLELLSRHWGEGVIEMTHEEDHAYAAGYSSGRATRTWRDRMRILERQGFIKVRKSGLRDFAQVLLIHPTLGMQGLYDAGKIGEDLWSAYRDLQRLSKERTPRELVPSDQS